MRKFLAPFVFAMLAFVTIAAQAQQQDSFFAGDSVFDGGNNLTINGTPYYNFDSGWIRNDGNHWAGNTNYITGFCANCGGYWYHGYFSFDLSSFAGTASTASFNVYSYLIRYDPGTYSIYGTSLTPSQVYSGNNFNSVTLYNDLVAGPLIGSLWVTPSNSWETVTVDLNAAGLTWLNANAGNQVVVGADFQETPEPGSLILLGSGLLGAAGVLRRKLRM